MQPAPVPRGRRRGAALAGLGLLLALFFLSLASPATAQPTAFADAPAGAAVAAPAPAAAAPTFTATANPNGCLLLFDLANAPALVGGSVTTEAGKPPSPLTAPGGVQVGGRLALQLASAACPQSWDELNKAGLTGAKIVPTAEPTLRLLPGKLSVKVSIGGQIGRVGRVCASLFAAVRERGVAGSRPGQCIEVEEGQGRLHAGRRERKKKRKRAQPPERFCAASFPPRLRPSARPEFAASRRPGWWRCGLARVRARPRRPIGRGGPPL